MSYGAGITGASGERAADATAPVSSVSLAAEIARLRRGAWTAAAIWTGTLALLALTFVVQHRAYVLGEARTRADMAWEKDLAYRRWVQRNGGVYVPISDAWPPNPFLKDIPERDITTPSGRRLTLVNSSYMMRQVAAAAGDRQTVVSRTVSLNPLRPENAPDRAEIEALRKLEQGDREVVWQESAGGVRYLRVMRPFLTEQACLKCHAHQGYKVGDLRGGIVTSVEIPTFLAGMKHVWPQLLGHLVLWACGLAGIRLAWRRLSRHACARHKAQDALAKSEARLAAAIQAASLGTYEMDVATESVIIDDGLRAMSGIPPHEEHRAFAWWLENLHPDDVPIVTRSYRELAEGVRDRDSLTTRLRAPDGSYRRIVVVGTVTDRRPDGKAAKIVGIWQDVTRQHEMEEALRAAAQSDRLTGLANRAALLIALQEAIDEARRSPAAKYAVLFFDFDHFKLINDSLGHEAGDRLLLAIARRLREHLDSVAGQYGGAKKHCAARLGGDEFVVLLRNLHSFEEAMRIGEQLLERLARPYELGGHSIVSTASIGLVTSDCGYERAEDVLRDADTAMYEAKSAGRGRLKIFAPDMRQKVRQRMELESDLRKALGTDELLLHYQPIVSLETGGVVGFEALARWRHPQRGMVSPAEFIPVAEDSGLILPLGEWIAREACRQIARTLEPGSTSIMPAVSINLSRRQLMSPDLPDRLAETARACGIEPCRVCLEITESAVMTDASAAAAVLRDIKRTGFKVALDDFGTGYSSLASLHMFPIDVLKIDRSFTANMLRGRDYAALIHTITNLARNLGMAVVAEGVETIDQVSLLQGLDCQFAQGFLFGRPMPANEIATYRPPLSLFLKAA